MKDFFKKFMLQLKIILQAPDFPTCTYLQKEVKKIEQKFKERIAPPEFCDFEKLLNKIYILWNTKGRKGLKELSYKEKKCLPWIIYKEKIINNIELLKAVLELFTPPKPYHLNALGYVYLKHFNFSPGNEVLREFIFYYLNLYKGKRKRLQLWKSKINFLFAKSAILNTGMWIITQKHPRICLEELGFTGELAISNFTREVVLFCLEKTVEDFKFLPVLLNLVKSPIDFTSVRFPEILPEMATKLIPKVEEKGDKDVQEKLIKFFLRYLKDPRFSDAIQWQKVSEQARKIFIQWLAQKDIEFFFEVVERTAGDINWRYRRKFWEAYLPYIEETRVFLGPKAMYLAKMWIKNLEYNFGKLVGGGKKAVILMQIGKYIFSEWAPIGACRVYEKSIIKNKIKADSCSSSDIYYSDIKFKQTHYSSEKYFWQKRLEDWIFFNLGIKPIKSYFVE